MRKFLTGLFYEQDNPSLTRVMSTIGFIAFLLTTGYLVYHKQNWEHYEIFANVAGGGSLGVRLLDKLGMNKFSSPVDVPYEKNNEEVK